MRYTSSLTIIITFLVTILYSQEFNSVRVAYFCPNDNIVNNIPQIDTAFLQRASNNNYTHIMVEYFVGNGDQFSKTSNWENGVYNEGVFNTGGLYYMLVRDINLVVQHGFEFILCIKVGSPGNHWLHAFGGLENAVSFMDIYKNTSGKSSSEIPCIAPNMQPEGFGRTFEQYMRVYQAACTQVNYKPEYISLGYSEAFTEGPKHALIYGTEKVPGDSSNGPSIDSLWMRDNKGDVVDLVAASLKHRITTIQNTVSGPLSNARVLVCGDLFSDEYQKARGIKLATKNLPKRAQKDALLVKNLVFLPRWFEEKHAAGFMTYNNTKAFKHFTENGFPVIYCRSITDGNMIHAIENRLPQLLNSVTAAKNNPDLICGYCSIHRDNKYYSPNSGGYDNDACWDAMEYLAYANGVAAPVVELIEVSPLLFDKTEVTQGSYLAITGQHPFSNWKKGDLNLPAENITWYDAILYCNARSRREGFEEVYTFTDVTMYPDNNNCQNLIGLTSDPDKNGYRLPTTQEWEHAYRAGSNTPFYWGKNYTTGYAVWRVGSPRPVGKKKANDFGLHDMAGNVWEYTWSDDPMTCTARGGSVSSFPSADDLKYNGERTCKKDVNHKEIGFRVVRR